MHESITKLPVTAKINKPIVSSELIVMANMSEPKSVGLPVMAEIAQPESLKTPVIARIAEPESAVLFVMANMASSEFPAYLSP